MVKLISILAFGLSLPLALAHPGEHYDMEEIQSAIRARNFQTDIARRTMADCSRSPEWIAREEAAITRRAATAERLRKERGLDNPSIRGRGTQDFTKWAKVSHDGKAKGYTINTPISTIFGASTSCILTPESSNGPYYVLGEQIRQNLVEGQAGIPMHIDLEFIDMATCKPAKDLIVDVWTCNALGVYSGVSAAGEAGLQSTYLRGVQVTGDDGSVQFSNIFPGHYSGRATHQHILTHSGSKVQPNGSFTGGKISHVGQVYFDESLRSAAEKMAPYNANKIAITSNAADFFTGQAASASYDPLFNYILLGPNLSDGILAWISLGIDQKADYTKQAGYAAYIDEKGPHDAPPGSGWNGK